MDKRLLWVWPLAVAASVVAVLVVRVIAYMLFPLPSPEAFPPLSWSGPIIFTVVLVSLAVFVFAFVVGRSAHPRRAYRRIALIALVVSMIPDVMLVTNGQPPAPWPAAIVLMMMHVAAWLVTVEVLTRLGFSKS